MSKDKQTEAMKQALEALKLALESLVESSRLLGVTQAKEGFGCYSREDAVFERAFYESIAKHKATIITALQSIISQDAIYKMAEESRTNGLRLDDWPKIGCVNHDCDQCKAVQEPVAVVTGYHGGRCVVLPINPARLFNSGTALYTAPPATQKPWVDLPDEEIDALAELYGLDYMSYAPFVRAVEQLLKEKNT